MFYGKPFCFLVFSKKRHKKSLKHGRFQACADNEKSRKIKFVICSIYTHNKKKSLSFVEPILIKQKKIKHLIYKLKKPDKNS